MELVQIIIVVLVLIVSYLYYLNSKTSLKQKQSQVLFIDSYQFPLVVRNNLCKLRPNLTLIQEEKVFQAFKDYFHICLMANGSKVAMPSKIVDNAWHEFILCTKEYAEFCQQAFGRFLHHTPADPYSKDTIYKEMKTAWIFACERDGGISHMNPHRLPLLFAIDSLLGLEDGMTYDLETIRTKADEGFIARSCS